MVFAKVLAAMFIFVPATYLRMRTMIAKSKQTKRVYGSHEILRKFIELFFVHAHVQAGLPQFFFFTILIEEGEGKVFIT